MIQDSDEGGFAANRRASPVDMFTPGAVTQKPAVYSSLPLSSVYYIALRCVDAELRCIIHCAPDSGIALPQSLLRLIYLVVALSCVIYYLKTVSALSDLGLGIFLHKVQIYCNSSSSSSNMPILPN